MIRSLIALARAYMRDRHRSDSSDESIAVQRCCRENDTPAMYWWRPLVNPGRKQESEDSHAMNAIGTA